MSQHRLDALVVQKGLATGRDQAKAYILAGHILVNGQRVDKAGTLVPETAELLFTGNANPFVSRGGLKLVKALEYFGIDLAGRRVLDLGASTGGFTDCLLQRGANRVYAVDVGKNQLHERLRADERVVNLEGVNLRHADQSLIPEMVDMVVADVSFISLTLVLPSCMPWLKPGGMLATLIKPQFELGPGETVKGVVRDEAARQRAVDKILLFTQANLALECKGVLPAAIKGPKGNQEYMALFVRQS